MKKPSVVKVKFYTILKDKLSVSEEELTGLNTVQEVLEELSRKYGEAFNKEVFDENGKIYNYYILLLNDRVVDREKPQDSKLKDGDVLHIFPPIAGGQGFYGG